MCIALRARSPILGSFLVVLESGRRSARPLEQDFKKETTKKKDLMKNFTCRRIVSSQTSLSSVFISPHLPPCSSLSPSLLLPASFSLLYRYNSHIHTCIHTCRTRTQQQPRSSGIATAHCGSCFRLNVFFFFLFFFSSFLFCSRPSVYQQDEWGTGS